eukprot:GILK01003259.1.p2 GENE.GILK01003259.1~~GILK01003259.1.p2  ORF type:complete len:328 (+),score=37.35 GILK01003259.1:2074-3057(+)
MASALLRTRPAFASFVSPFSANANTRLLLIRTLSTVQESQASGSQTADQQRVAAAMSVAKDQMQKNSSMSSNDASNIYELGAKPSVDVGNDYNLPHPIWHGEYVYRVKPTHRPPEDLIDKLALATIRATRFNFDWMSGWMFGKPTVEKAVRRICFLETVAGVPGSIAGIIRHLSSLRRMQRDHGWIHTLFEEAENERMHLLTYLQLKKPTAAFRGAVWLTQGIFFNFFFFAYLVSPRFCHRLVGYLEEEAVNTYTHILADIDSGGELAVWKTTPAPPIAKSYWKLPDTATMRDVVAVTRADEAHHRDVNHEFASLKPHDPNPFKPGH